MRVLCCLWRWGGHMASNCGCDLLELSAASGWQPARRGRPQSYNCKELNSANYLNELEVEFSRRAFWWELSLASALVSALCHPEWRTQPCHAQTPDLQNQELMNRCCSSHQVYGRLLHGNRKLLPQSNPYSILTVSHPGLRLRCSATLILGLSLRKAWLF